MFSGFFLLPHGLSLGSMVVLVCCPWFYSPMVVLVDPWIVLVTPVRFKICVPFFLTIYPLWFGILIDTHAEEIYYSSSHKFQPDIA